METEPPRTMATGKIVLYTSDNSLQQFTHEEPNVTTDFAGCKVNKGMWILYEQPRYNDSVSGAGQIRILDEADGFQQLKFTPRSIRVVRSYQVGVTLYKHDNFGGEEQLVSQSTTSISLEVSSMLVSQGTWKLYQKPFFQGPYHQIPPGQYKNAGEFGIPNDSLRSMDREF